MAGLAGVRDGYGRVALFYIAGAETALSFAEFFNPADLFSRRKKFYFPSFLLTGGLKAVIYLLSDILYNTYDVCCWAYSLA
ncbi:MAG: hypothetical protein LBU23_09235, partial [Planctomycetota bacterium]|nr:hypothetical protein [Planctomycetota bacterium]